MRRAVLYFFFDKDGVVDRYNLCLLEDLKKNAEKIYVVVNGTVTPEGRKKFEQYADDVYERENTGLDVWAYKDGMAHIGWDVVTSYDEFILMNYTNFGPVYPFKEMFDAMDARAELDFWGITKHYGHDFDPYNACEYGYIPPHIQSSFIAVRKKFMQTEDYRKYWEDMPMITSYVDSICRHEAVFTEKFTRLGYKSDVYVDTSDMKEYIDYPLMLCATKLVKEKRCPVFKRKMFFNVYEEFMDTTCGQPAVEFYDYLRNETDYDVDLIWESILRTANLYDIKQRMQLNYVLPRSMSMPLKGAQPRVALFMHIYYLDMMEEMASYAKNMPAWADIYISTNTAEKKQAIEEYFKDFGGRKVTVLQVDNRGREYAGFLIAFRPYYEQYDFTCIIHGKKSRYEKPYIIGDSFAYHCFENTIPTADYVMNVLATFEDNPRLGLLVPPVPSHAMYYTTISREWRGDYLPLVDACKAWDIHAQIDPSKPPVAPLGGFFWFRNDALKKLFSRPFVYEDFPEEPCTAIDGTIMHVIERIYPFVAQDAGYYAAVMMSDRYSAMRDTNQYKTIRDINEIMFWVFGECDRHALMKHLIESVNNTPQESMGTKKLLRILAKRMAGEKGCALYRKVFKGKKVQNP